MRPEAVLLLLILLLAGCAEERTVKPLPGDGLAGLQECWPKYPNQTVLDCMADLSRRPVAPAPPDGWYCMDRWEFDQARVEAWTDLDAHWGVMLVPEEPPQEEHRYGWFRFIGADEAHTIYVNANTGGFFPLDEPLSGDFITAQDIHWEGDLLTSRLTGEPGWLNAENMEVRITSYDEQMWALFVVTQGGVEHYIDGMRSALFSGGWTPAGQLNVSGNGYWFSLDTQPYIPSFTTEIFPVGDVTRGEGCVLE